MTEAQEQYQPRTGDGSIPAEDDSLRRQPSDDVAEDPDTARAPGPEDPAEGPDDPAYTGEADN